MTDYYDWRRTLSYDAEVNIIITPRGRGKTFGFRKQAVADFLKDGSRFVEIVRYKPELPQVMNGYFDKLQASGLYTDYVFKCERRAAFIARKPEDPDEKIKGWEQIGYFCSLSEQQMLKKVTFVNVRRIMFDEAIMDNTDRLHRYLFREFDVLTNLVDTISRQRPGEETKVRLYLCGNAVDLMNPYFRRYGVRKQPEAGYSWHNKKTCLLHFEKPEQWGEQRKADTIVGHMSSSENDAVAFFNDFYKGNPEYVSRKSRNARFKYGIIYDGERFGVWVDWKLGLIYVDSKIPTDASTIYALTLDDGSINYIIAERTIGPLRALSDAFRNGLVRFSTESIQARFTEVLQLLGVR